MCQGGCLVLVFLTIRMSIVVRDILIGVSIQISGVQISGIYMSWIQMSWIG
jgi:hypothetical protein